MSSVNSASNVRFAANGSGALSRDEHQSRAAFPLIRVLLACGTLLFGGCARDSPLSLDSKIATRQANLLLPKGTPEARATRILQAKGFRVSRLNADTAVNHLLVGTCTKQKHTWIVGVVIIDGRVATCTVTISEA